MAPLSSWIREPETCDICSMQPSLCFADYCQTGNEDLWFEAQMLRAQVQRVAGEVVGYEADRRRLWKATITARLLAGWGRRGAQLPDGVILLICTYGFVLHVEVHMPPVLGMPQQSRLHARMAVLRWYIQQDRIDLEFAYDFLHDMRELAATRQAEAAAALPPHLATLGMDLLFVDMVET